MTGTIFLGGTRFAGACPAPGLGWPGERKSIGATSKRRFSKISWWAAGEGKSGGLQGLGARASGF